MYFNHSDLVVDASAYDAIAQSQFLKEEFVHVTETTVRRSADQTVTGLVIQGRRTYLSIFKTGSMVLPNQPAPEGQVNFNMWIDDRTKLPLIRDSLARTTHTDARLSQISRAFQSRIVAPFDVAAPSYPDSADVRARSTVISRNLEVFRLLYPDLSPSQYGTTREIAQLVSNRYLPELLMNDVTRFTVVVSHAELERLQETFEAYGYTLRREGDRRGVTGPEIEFVLIPAADPGLQRRIAVELKLNRAYTGDRLHRFGAGSEIELHRDTATWRFPAGWHP
jgi:Family of unknown function (DUF5829)